MPDAMQIAGLLIQQLSPAIVNYVQADQQSKALVKTKQIQSDMYKEAHAALFRDRVGSALTPVYGKPVCKACEVPSLIKVMGPKIWAHLHSLPATLPKEPSQDVQDRFANYVTSLVQNLPCPVCANSGLEYIRDNPIDVSSREGLARWVCEFHDAKNRELGKPVHGCQVVRINY